MEWNKLTWLGKIICGLMGIVVYIFLGVVMLIAQIINCLYVGLNNLLTKVK